jgi:hypothetical protein
MACRPSPRAQQALLAGALLLLTCWCASGAAQAAGSQGPAQGAAARPGATARQAGEAPEVRSLLPHAAVPFRCCCPAELPPASMPAGPQCLALGLAPACPQEGMALPSLLISECSAPQQGPAPQLQPEAPPLPPPPEEQQAPEPQAQQGLLRHVQELAEQLGALERRLQSGFARCGALPAARSSRPRLPPPATAALRRWSLS